MEAKIQIPYTEQLEKEKIEAQEMRQQLQEHQEQNDSVLERAQKLKDELESKQA